MDLYKHVYTLDREEVEKISAISDDAKNVLRGIQPHCFGLVEKERFKFDLVYVIGTPELKGYILRHPFEQREGYYERIMFFCHFLSLRFDIVDPVNLYNTYLSQIRTRIEGDYFTVTSDELKAMFRKTGSTSATMVHPDPIEIMPFMDKSEFYKAFLKVPETFDTTPGIKYVYVMLNNLNGMFKIGRSSNPLKREKTLQSQEPEVEMLYCWNAEESVERHLHYMFHERRVRGEWFKLNTKDIIKLRKYLSEFQS